MPQFLYANNASSTLAGPIAANATVVNLAGGTGALFPNPGVGQQFALTFVSAGNPNTIEIVYCTGRNGDACTIVRGQEGTSATSFVAGDLASNDLTAGTCAAFIQVAQQQIDAPNYGIDTGPVNTLQVTLNPQPGSAALIAGTAIRILVGHTNTGPTTLTITGLPTTTVFAQNGVAPLQPASIVGGQIYEFVYVLGVGFEVATARVLITLPNTWSQTQTIANAINWSGNNSSGAVQPLIGVDSVNEAVLFAGPSGSSAWKVLNTLGTNVLMSLGFNGSLNVVGGLSTSSGSINSAANVVANGGRLRAIQGTTNSGDVNAAPILNDFLSSSGAGGGWTTIPSYGLGASNSIIIQWGTAVIPGQGGTYAFNLPRAFPAVFASININYGAALPPSTGAVGASPANLSQFIANNTSASAVANGCYFLAIGW
jgi:hypothetical protein